MSGITAGPGAPAPDHRGKPVPGPRGAVQTGGTTATRAVAAARTRGAVDKARAALQGSPGRLRIAAIACVVACLAFAALADWALQTRASALSQARAHADQLVRIQQIASDVVAADSQFTNGYLTFGQDSTAQLTSYDTAIAQASQLIARAAAAEPADAAQLATVNEALTAYNARVAAARANNRQGFQVGVGYLRQASTLLQSDQAEANLLPTLGALVDANSQRVDDAFTTARNATWILVAGGLLGLGVLLGAQFWLARRTHRILNLPLLVATGAVVLALVAGGSVMAVAQSKAKTVRNNSYAATLALANARIDAYVGKSYQSIALIYIGTGGDYPTSQKAYQKQVTDARTALSAAAGTGVHAGSAELTKWTAANDALYAQAQRDWIGATEQATSTAPGGVNKLFAAFDDATRPALDQQVRAVDDGLTSSHTALVALGWLALLLGLFAAVAAWLGISLRLEEYR